MFSNFNLIDSILNGNYQNSIYLSNAMDYSNKKTINEFVSYFQNCNQNTNFIYSNFVSDKKKVPLTLSSNCDSDIDLEIPFNKLKIFVNDYYDFVKSTNNNYFS
jgi:hypothetical protein